MAAHKLLAGQLTGAPENALRFDESHFEEGFCHRLRVRSHVQGKGVHEAGPEDRKREETRR